MVARREDHCRREYDPVPWPRHCFCSIHAAQTYQARDQGFCSMFRVLWSYVRIWSVLRCRWHRKDNSAIAIVDRLLQNNNLHTARGRVVYTDNWYTTVALARHLYKKYGMFFCGTLNLTEKKAREDLDPTFLKLKLSRGQHWTCCNWAGFVKQR